MFHTEIAFANLLAMKSNMAAKIQVGGQNCSERWEGLAVACTTHVIFLPYYFLSHKFLKSDFQTCSHLYGLTFDQQGILYLIKNIISKLKSNLKIIGVKKSQYSSLAF